VSPTIGFKRIYGSFVEFPYAREDPVNSLYVTSKSSRAFAAD